MLYDLRIFVDPDQYLLTECVHLSDHSVIQWSLQE